MTSPKPVNTFGFVPFQVEQKVNLPIFQSIFLLQRLSGILIRITLLTLRQLQPEDKKKVRQTMQFLDDLDSMLSGLSKASLDL
jgi:hypothetical protein